MACTLSSIIALKLGMPRLRINYSELNYNLYKNHVAETPNFVYEDEWKTLNIRPTSFNHLMLNSQKSYYQHYR